MLEEPDTAICESAKLGRVQRRQDFSDVQLCVDYQRHDALSLDVRVNYSRAKPSSTAKAEAGCADTVPDTKPGEANQAPPGHALCENSEQWLGRSGLRTCIQHRVNILNVEGDAMRERPPSRH